MPSVLGLCSFHWLLVKGVNECVSLSPSLPASVSLSLSLSLSLSVRACVRVCVFNCGNERRSSLISRICNQDALFLNTLRRAEMNELDLIHADETPKKRHRKFPKGVGEDLRVPLYV